jgi:hypothetical protein
MQEWDITIRYAHPSEMIGNGGEVSWGTVSCVQEHRQAEICELQFMAKTPDQLGPIRKGVESSELELYFANMVF